MSRLIANRAFRYESRELSVDEEFQAQSKDIVALTRANNPLARSPTAGAEDGQEPSEQPDAEPDLLDQNKRTKRYNRRDMRPKE